MGDGADEGAMWGEEAVREVGGVAVEGGGHYWSVYNKCRLVIDESMI